jgi:single-stranded-DNA-specific exonuclease
MIVTDHHLPGEALPKAFSIICPKKENDPYPEKNLAGVGVAFKVAEALLKERSSDEMIATEWLDLVAVGTVADLVPLTGENRALVKSGLKIIREKPRQGLHSLAGAANLNLQQIHSRDIGFVLGPRLNAAGRLGTARDAFDLLMSEYVSEAGRLALDLDDQNRERQELMHWIQEEAQKQVESSNDYLLFAAHEEFHEGVVGLAASRITDLFYRPSAVGHRGKDFTRASCRSIPEFHITKALDECSDYLEQYGGHAMAAGFTVRNEMLDEFIEEFQNIARRELASKDLLPVLRADMEIPLKDIKPEEMFKVIAQIEPVGSDNPEVLFVSRNLQVRNYRVVGRDSSHLKLTVTDGVVTYDAIAFKQGYWAGKLPEYVDLLYSYEKNAFNGRVTLQLNVVDIKESR